jgi:hypothetical protein
MTREFNHGDLQEFVRMRQTTSILWAIALFLGTYFLVTWGLTHWVPDSVAERYPMLVEKDGNILAMALSALSGLFFLVGLINHRHHEIHKHTDPGSPCRIRTKQEEQSKGKQHDRATNTLDLKPASQPAVHSGSNGRPVLMHVTTADDRSCPQE